MLVIKDLVVQRAGKPVLHGIDLEIAPGSIAALLGANGAGKSSTVLAVAGLLPIQRGEILSDGAPLQKLRPEAVRAAGVAVVPEGHRILGELTVLDNLLAAATLLPRSQADQSVEQLLTLFPELRERLGVLGRSLSGGQKQMVCIAQALIARPKYLLIDELSLGLAPTIVKRLAEVIQRVAAEGVGVLLIEQFTTLALSISSQVFVLERGRMAFRGSADELRRKPEILHSSYLASAA